jgi:hypothetical protein
MTATIIRPAVWDRALPALPRAASKPDAPAIVRYVGNPLTAALVAQVDRRAALRGTVHCKWRGTIPEREYDSWRYDEALRRVQLPHKWERGE